MFVWRITMKMTYNIDLKVWIDDYITQMEFEQEDEASLEEQECKG